MPTFTMLKDMDATYKKIEKLKSKKLISELFEKGKTITAYPLKLVYLETRHNDGAVLKTGVSVSKRHFKKAVHRNKIKRLLREAYQHHKAVYFNNTSKHYAFMILYIDKEMPDSLIVQAKMKKLFERFHEKHSK